MRRVFDDFRNMSESFEAGSFLFALTYPAVYKQGSAFALTLTRSNSQVLTVQPCPDKH